MNLTGEQIRAARALLRIEQSDLAELSGVSLPSIKRLEAMQGQVESYARTIEAIRTALEKAGVTFIEQNGEGPGCRLSKRLKERGSAVKAKPKAKAKARGK